MVTDILPLSEPSLKPLVRSYHLRRIEYGTMLCFGSGRGVAIHRLQTLPREARFVSWTPFHSSYRIVFASLAMAWLRCDISTANAASAWSCMFTNKKGHWRGCRPSTSYLATKLPGAQADCGQDFKDVWTNTPVTKIWSQAHAWSEVGAGNANIWKSTSGPNCDSGPNQHSVDYVNLAISKHLPFCDTGALCIQTGSKVRRGFLKSEIHVTGRSSSDLKTLRCGLCSNVL